MIYGLPTSLPVNGKDYKIRSDYRAVLDVLSALNDPDLDDTGKAQVLLQIFYEEWETIPQRDYQEAIDGFFEFLRCGEEEPKKKAPKLMDWEQDFKYIIAPVNKIAGKELRSVEYCHWWTFMSYYQEIGESTFSTIVGIRSKLAKGKKLDKSEQEWYRENKDMVDFKNKYSEQDLETLKLWGGK